MREEREDRHTEEGYISRGIDLMVFGTLSNGELVTSYGFLVISGMSRDGGSMRWTYRKRMTTGELRLMKASGQARCLFSMMPTIYGALINWEGCPCHINVRVLGLL